eukprot:1426251-Pleurochrysis_carterae.AAC.1
MQLARKQPQAGINVVAGFRFAPRNLEQGPTKNSTTCAACLLQPLQTGVGRRQQRAGSSAGAGCRFVLYNRGR